MTRDTTPRGIAALIPARTTQDTRPLLIPASLKGIKIDRKIKMIAFAETADCDGPPKLRIGPGMVGIVLGLQIDYVTILIIGEKWCVPYRKIELVSQNTPITPRFERPSSDIRLH